MQESQTALLTSPEVAALLRISVATLGQWRWKKWIPYVRVNGAVRYRQSDIEALITASVKPVTARGDKNV